VLVGEDGVLPFVFTAVDWESFTRLPAPDGAFAATELGRDLLPRFQSFLRGVPLRHRKAPRKTIPEATR
jgi:hypothetical protein